ncbi:uncharacterized protein LOC135633997 [Musa acuminata AAA Group]|uniref:uncharacterized protein LOC135633997 n=1 Tax=Musa acuminata AAA Group TaxID=214697 RepID=UPI0031D8EC4B
MHVTHTRRGTTESFALTACHQRVRTPGFGTAAHRRTVAAKPKHPAYPAAVPPAWCYKSRKKKKKKNPRLLKKLGDMSGAQGAQPKESLTPTTYESVPAEENKTRLDPRSKEDEGVMIKIEKQQDKVEDAAGGGGPVFGAGKEEHKPDLGVTGTG